MPSDNSRVRRFSFSDSSLKMGAFLTVLLASFSIFSVAGLLYYRDSYRNLVIERSRDQAFLQEKTTLLARLDKLSSAVERTSHFASKLESVMGLNAAEVQTGIGPISVYPQMAEARETKFVDFKIDRLEQDVHLLEDRINGAYGRYQDKMVYLSSTPSIWPVKGWVTSEFGVRRHPLHQGNEKHEGVDISAQWGSPILAPADGIVTYAGYRGGLGKSVTIQHGFGVSTVYGHSSRLYVHVGQKVKRGDRIAAVGSTGRSTGPHLHYEVRMDRLPVNPMEFVLE